MAKKHDIDNAIDVECIPIQYIEKILTVGTLAGYRCVSEDGKEIFRIEYTEALGTYILDVVDNGNIHSFHMEGVRNSWEAKRFLKDYLKSFYLDIVLDEA